MIAASPWSKAATVAALLLFAAVAPAASFNVAPVSVALGSGADSGVLEFTNTGSERAAIQVTPVEWRQDADGNDQYTPTGSLIAVPPIFELAPQETQLVRIGLLDQSTQPGERTFRLFFEELPVETERDSAAVRMRLRIGVPVFVGTGRDAATLTVKSIETGESGTRVQLANDGIHHVKLLDLSVLDAAGIEIAKLSGCYLLPGTRREFNFEGDMRAAETLRLRTADSGASEYAIPSLP